MAHPPIHMHKDAIDDAEVAKLREDVNGDHIKPKQIMKKRCFNVLCWFYD